MTTIELQDWQQRVVIEFNDLEEKIKNLVRFLESDEFKKLDLVQQVLLESQNVAMLQYHDILKQRIDMFGFKTAPKQEFAEA